MPRLLINADDFGLHADIDRGIVECANAGVVRSISICVQGPSLDWNAVRDLRQHGVFTGLHVTLVGEPWISQSRNYADWKQLIRALSAGGRTMRDAVEREVRAQLDRFQTAAGFAPDHVDSHQHVHLFTGVWKPCLAIADELKVRIRVPFARWSNIKPSVAGTVLQVIALKRRRELAKRAIRPLTCIGLAGAGHNTTAQLLKELSHEKGRDVELVGHPGINSSELSTKYANWNFDWDAERKALLSPAFLEGVTQLGFSLESTERRS